MLYMEKTLKDNSLAIIFMSLFVACLAAQSATGLFSYNETLRDNRRDPIGYAAYLGTGDFLDGIFANWQAAILQLTCLIVFEEVFRQRGAAHSRKPEKDPKKKQQKRKESKDKDVPWIYRNSLSLAFFTLFAGSFVAHMVFGTWSYNESRALTHHDPVSIAAYLLTGSFWFKAVQTWQAEFIGILLYLVLSIFLRQEGSAESKPVRSIIRPRPKPTSSALLRRTHDRTIGSSLKAFAACARQRQRKRCNRGAALLVVHEK
jgi:hypothetical protein